MSKREKFFWLILILGFLLLGVREQAEAVDVLNCSKCHQHRELKILTKEGTIRDFHVNPEVFNTSAHQKLTCQTCHSYITKTPHDPASYRKVDCSVECHIEEEAFSKEYTHQKEYSQYVRSVHGEANEDTIGCVACHTEHSELRSAEYISVEINNTCVNCHEDTELMAKHKISAATVASYGDSFHGKAANFEVKNIATCVSCHTTHDIRRPDDSRSAVYFSKKNKVCQTEDCHKGSAKRFGAGTAHLLYEGGVGIFMNKLGMIAAFWVFLGIAVMFFHYTSTFLHKLSQENWRYLATFIYILVLAIAAPYILRLMMELRSEEIPFDIAKLTPEYKSFCRTCHGVLPHKKNLVLRAFMNRHSNKLSCETCHIKRKTGDSVSYLWYNGQMAYILDFRGKDFDNGSKIMPYKLVGDKKVVIEMQKDGTLPLSYIVDKKGIDCAKCHTEEAKGILDFTSLGYPNNEIKNLRKLEEFEMLTKAQGAFNMPTLW